MKTLTTSVTSGLPRVLSILGCMCFIAPLTIGCQQTADKADEKGDRAAQRTENRVDRETDQALDRGLDRLFE